MLEMKPYPGNPHYAVTRCGRVFRISKPVAGRVCPYELKRRLNKSGYPIIGGGKNTLRVHRMVAETWIPNMFDLPEVAHENGVRSDCREENLRWDTHRGNMDDMKRHGTVLKGEAQPNRKLSVSEIKAGRQRRAQGERLCDIARDYPHVSRSTLGRALIGRTWGHV